MQDDMLSSENKENVPESSTSGLTLKETSSPSLAKREQTAGTRVDCE